MNLIYKYELIPPIDFMLKYDKELGEFKIKNYKGSGIFIQCEKKTILNNNSLFSFCSTLIKVEIKSNENKKKNNESEIILSVIHGINKGKQYSFSSRKNPIIQIGRIKESRDNIDIEFNEDSVSKFQTKIYYYKKNWYIIDGNGLDHKSGNGTWLLIDVYTKVWDNCYFRFGNDRFKIEYKYPNYF